MYAHGTQQHVAGLGAAGAGCMPSAITKNTQAESLQGVTVLFYMQNAKWLVTDPCLGVWPSGPGNPALCTPVVVIMALTIASGTILQTSFCCPPAQSSMASNEGLHGAAHQLGASLKLTPAHACPCSPGHNACPGACYTLAKPRMMPLSSLISASCLKQRVWYARGVCKQLTYGNLCTLGATQRNPPRIYLHRSFIKETSLHVWFGPGTGRVAMLHGAGVKLLPALSRFWVGLRARGMISHRPPDLSLKHSEHRSPIQRQF